MSRAETGTASVYHRTVVYLLFIILLLPLLGTFVYSIASSWSATVLPSGFTFKWYLQLWSDPRFLTAFGHSLLICFGSLHADVVRTSERWPISFRRSAGCRPGCQPQCCLEAAPAP